jgi:hypothetical protein
MYDTKTIVDIGSSSIYVILTGENGYKSDCTFNLATGYPNNLIKLDEFAWRSRSLSDHSFSSYNYETSNSTTYVTIKSFRVRLSGTITVRASFATSDSDATAYLRFLKNGSAIYYKNTTSTNETWTDDVNIDVNPGDLIEEQVCISNANYYVKVWRLQVDYCPYRATDFYDINP